MGAMGAKSASVAGSTTSYTNNRSANPFYLRCLPTRDQMMNTVPTRNKSSPFHMSKLPLYIAIVESAFKKLFDASAMEKTIDLLLIKIVKGSPV